MTTGELAARAGINKESLRFYEREGLLPKPDRTQAGYRRFGDDDLKRVVFIKNAQKFGFGLKEIRDLLSIADGDLIDREEVRRIAQQKVALIDRQIDWLTLMRDTMKELIEQCAHSNSTEPCPIIERLAEDAHSCHGRAGGEA